MFNNISVFIFGADGRQTLPVCKGFYTIGCTVVCYCESKIDTGKLTRYRSKAIIYNEIKKQNEDFCSCGSRLIKENHFDLVVPLGDEIAKYLSRNKPELSRYSRIAVNDWDIFQYAIDKLKTMHICQELGIPSPKTIESENPIDEINSINFPVVVKPRTGIGSIGFQIIKDKEQLISYWNNYDNANGALLIQEYVEQGNNPQLRADFYRDRDGVFRLAMVGKVTRWFPIDGGSGIFVYTIHDDTIIENCKKLLDAIQWKGYANIDLVMDEKTKEAKILEINGRTGASIKIDYIAGANVSRLILEDELGFPVTDMLQYEDNHKMSCFLPDVLWLIKSKNRFTTEPSWFDRKGVYDAIFSWDDPLPSLGFILHSIQSFTTGMKKRKRI